MRTAARIDDGARAHAAPDPAHPGHWLTLTAAGPGRAVGPPRGPLPWRWLLGGFAVVTVLVLVGVALAGSVIVHRAAEREAVDDAVRMTDLLAESVVVPALRDGLVDGDPDAFAELDAAVRRGLLGDTIIRVKLWSASGTIVYSDEPRLVGQRFELDEGESEALREARASAEFTDLSRPENAFERGRGGDELLEVYRPVRTPDGEVLLFETYARYDAVDVRATHLWSSFGAIVVVSLVLLVLAQTPLVWGLLMHVRRIQRDREQTLTRAVAASDEERRRIAAALHDGAVQELAASAYLVAGVADRARARGDAEAADRLEVAAGSVRTSIGGLRSLLVDIYPPTLRRAGISAALADLAAPLRARDIAVALDLPAGATLSPEAEDLVFRVARELVRNAASHAGAGAVRISLAVPADPARSAVLEVADDGIGLDPEVIARPPEGHLGTRLVTDLAAAAGARLQVRSAPGRGTTWRMELPR